MKNPLGLYRKCTDGVAAVEFAIVGPIALTMMFAILETGLICTRISLLDNAVSNASKYIYTGAAQSQNIDQEALQQYICQQMRGFFRDCEENITLELSAIDELGATSGGEIVCRDNTTEIVPVVGYTPQGSGKVTFIRACVTTDIALPGLGLWMALSKTSTGRYQITSSATFLNEPF